MKIIRLVSSWVCYWCFLHQSNALPLTWLRYVLVHQISSTIRQSVGAEITRLLSTLLYKGTSLIRLLISLARTLRITAIRRKDILLDLIRSQCQYQRCRYKRQLRRPHSWRAITLCASQVGDLKNLDLLDSGATDTFTNLRPMREETFTATVGRIISYGVPFGYYV